MEGKAWHICKEKSNLAVPVHDSSGNFRARKSEGYLEVFDVQAQELDFAWSIMILERIEHMLGFLKIQVTMQDRNCGQGECITFHKGQDGR